MATLFGYGFGVLIIAFVLLGVFTRRRRTEILSTEEGKRAIERLSEQFYKQITVFTIGVGLVFAVAVVFGHWFTSQAYGQYVLISLFFLVPWLCWLSFNRLIATSAKGAVERMTAHVWQLLVSLLVGATIAKVSSKVFGDWFASVPDRAATLFVVFVLVPWLCWLAFTKIVAARAVERAREQLGQLFVFYIVVLACAEVSTKVFGDWLASYPVGGFTRIFVFVVAPCLCWLAFRTLAATRARQSGEAHQ